METAPEVFLSSGSRTAEFHARRFRRDLPHAASLASGRKTPMGKVSSQPQACPARSAFANQRNFIAANQPQFRCQGIFRRARLGHVLRQAGRANSGSCGFGPCRRAASKSSSACGMAGSGRLCTGLQFGEGLGFLLFGRFVGDGVAHGVLHRCLLAPHALG